MAMQSQVVVLFANPYHMDITQFEVKEIETEGNKKYFLKGARLHFYPPAMNLYRCSRGVHRPVESEMLYHEAKEKVRDTTRTFQQSFNIQFGERNIKISKQYYNSHMPTGQV